VATWNNDEMQTTMNAVMKKAAADKDFRKLVLDDPYAAIRSVAGKDVPKGYRIKVIENEPGIDRTFVLPNYTGTELTDAQLHSVAGGDCILAPCVEHCYSHVCAAAEPPVVN